MKGLVSKVRAKSTKSREKQATKASSEKLPLSQGPATGIAVALVLWALSVLIIGIDQINTHQSGLSFVLPLTAKAVILLMSIFGIGLAFNGDPQA
jgi:hypothetical protein